MDSTDLILPVGFGICCICSRQRKLTFEHIPPKKAFNSGGGRSTTLEQLIAQEEGHHVRYKRERKGFGRFSLCEDCNNNTGAWYGNDYIDWAWQGLRFQGNSGRLAMPFHIFPGRIAKQIIAMFASIAGPNLLEKNPQLRKFVLDREAVGLPPKFRLYAYLTSPDSEGRTSGIIASMNLGHSGPSVFSEIAYRPFGYILTMGSDPPSSGLFDMTFFCFESFRSYRDLHLPLPTKHVHSHFPADFRTKEEWEKAKVEHDTRRAYST
jgi:hypothetical protein